MGKTIQISSNGHNATDAIDDAIVTMDVRHSNTHRGITFRSTHLFTVPGVSSIYYQFKTGAKVVHFKNRHLVNDANTVLFQVYEDPTVTDGTTEIPVYNSDRNNSSASTVKWYSDPTNISGGTLTDQVLLVGTKDNSAGGNAFDIEWIYKPNTSYIVKVTNQGSGNVQVMVRYFWYERSI